MSSSNFQPIDKAEATGILLKHIASYHNLIEEESANLDSSSLKLTEFLMKVWDKESEHKVIYQYAVENQAEFEKQIKILAKATSSIYPIIENLQKEIYSTLKPAPQTPQAEGSTNLSVINQRPPEKESLFRNPFAKKPKLETNITDISSYTRSMDVVDETLQVPVFLRKLKSHHWHGVTRSACGLLHTTKIQHAYLWNEIRYFHTEVEPRIQQIVDEARRLKIKEEKGLIGPILTSARELADRRSFQPLQPV